MESQDGEIVLIWLWLAVGCAAILGHIFPLYLKFKGGKGVATSFGVALGLWPYFTISAISPHFDSHHSPQNKLGIDNALAVSHYRNGHPPDGYHSTPRKYSKTPGRHRIQNPKKTQN